MFIHALDTAQGPRSTLVIGARIGARGKTSRRVAVESSGADSLDTAATGLWDLEVRAS